MTASRISQHYHTNTERVKIRSEFAGIHSCCHLPVSSKWQTKQKRNTIRRWVLIVVSESSTRSKINTQLSVLDKTEHRCWWPTNATCWSLATLLPCHHTSFSVADHPGTMAPPNKRSSKFVTFSSVIYQFL